MQTSMGDDTLQMCTQMIVCLRDGVGNVHSKEAVGQLRAIYPDEAKNAELDITAQFKVR